MNPAIDVIGIYRVETDQSVHLIEILVKNLKGKFDLSEITQEIDGQPKRNWQVPWDEKILDSAGERVIADCFLAEQKPELWMGNIRMVFFFHHINFSKPLITPFGPLNLLNESSRPDRLSEIAYESPD